MPSKTAMIEYVTKDVPAGSPVPVLWWDSLWQNGAQVGDEQTFTTPVPEVVFSAPAGAGYTIKSGQRDVANAEVGEIVVSDPFDLEADITITLVSKITIKVAM